MQTIRTRQRRTATTTPKLPIVDIKSSCDFNGYDADILIRETAKLKLITKKED